MRHLSFVYRILFIIALTGLLTTLILQILAFAGYAVPKGVILAVFVCIFPVFFGGVIGFKKYAPQPQRGDPFSNMKIPGIAKVVLILLLAYSLLTTFMTAFGGDLRKRRKSDPPLTLQEQYRADISHQRIVSSLAMAFYTLSSAMIYSIGQYKKEEEESNLPG